MKEQEYITYLLQEAKRLESIGQKGIAKEKYEEVLRLEPGNEEAKKGVGINLSKFDKINGIGFKNQENEIILSGFELQKDFSKPTLSSINRNRFIKEKIK